MTSKTYEARTFGMVFVWEDGKRRELDPRFDLRCHSPDGYAWGYGGSGPAQLALAILCDFLQDDDKAQALYQRFKEFAVATRSRDHPFRITDEEVLEAVVAIEAERATQG